MMEVEYNEDESCFDSSLQDDIVQETITLDEILEICPSIDNCILINNVYQELVNETLNKLQLYLEDNLQQQDQLKNAIDEAAKDPNAAKKYKHVTVFSKPYFRNRVGFTQPPNEDQVSKYANQYHDLYSKPAKKWTRDEIDQLRDAVRSSALEQMLQPLIVREEILTEKLKPCHLKNKVRAEIEEKLRKCNEETSQIKAYSDKKLFGEIDKDHDWLAIANVNFEGKRTPLECKLKWKNVIHPQINRSKWTVKEDAKLKAAFEKFNGKNWDLIAAELNTNRTAIECFERYQREHNETIRKSTWTSDEDAALFETIENCRIGNYIPWHQVTYYMEGRTKEQVFRRWSYNVNPVLKHGKWSETEDLLLLSAVTRHGTAWKIVCVFVPGRTSTQCRDRYVNSLDITVTSKEWTAEDDKKLLELYKVKGAKWSEISTYFPGRTDAMISKRYFLLESIPENSNFDKNEQLYRPRSVARRRPYRIYIYRKLLEDLIKLKDPNDDTVISHSLEEMVKLLAEVDQKLLDIMIRELNKKLMKEKRHQQRLVISSNYSRRVYKFELEDMYFVQYFIAMNLLSYMKVNQPLTNDTANDSDSNNIVSTVVFLQALGSQVRISNKVMDNIIPQQTLSSAISESAIIPPTVTTTMMYKQMTSLVQHFLPALTSKNYHEGIQANDAAKRLKEQPFCRQVDDDEKSKLTILAKRFINLFFWPALMGNIKPVGSGVSENRVLAKSRKKKERQSKRKRKKPWVSHRMRKLANQRWQTKMAEENAQNISTEDSLLSVNKTPEIDVDNPKPKLGRPFGSVNKKPKPIVSELLIRKSQRIGMKTVNKTVINT